jgi:hypothetical protein
MTEYWLSPEELSDLTGWKDSTIRHKAAARQLKCRPVGEQKPNGRRAREYSSLSLPTDLQVKLNSRRVALAVIDPAREKTNSAQLIVFGPQSASAEAPCRAVTDAQKEQIAKRLAVINPMLEYSQLETPAERRCWCIQNGREVKNLSDLVLQIAKEHESKPSTIWTWYGNFKRKGADGLFDRFRSDRGQSRWFAKHRDAAILAAHLYLNERTSISFIADQIEYEAQALSLSEDDLPSRETIRVFLSKSVSPAMKTLAREGLREYRERMAPYLKRGYVDVYANQIWVGDHAIHDVEISNDLFFDVPFGTPGRLRMSAFVDYRSRKAWATWAWEGSSRSISATMVRAMLEVGPPEGVYVDNGRDYKKVAKGAAHACDLPEYDDDAKAPKGWWEEEYKTIAQTGILSRLGISVTHCIPRHPQSKHVERFFQTMHMHFDAVHSTYTSGSPFTRPESTEKAMMRHRRLLKAGRVEESDHPLASRFILGCLSWIAEYNDTPQRGEGMDGRSPNEVFSAELNPNQKPVPDAATLALLFCERVQRTVRECAVQLRNYRYTPRPEDRMAWAAMHEANETEILIDWNPEDPEFALALTMDGRVLGWLEAEPLLRFAPNDPATQSQIAESMSIRRGLEKATKQTLKAIAATARANGAQTAEDALYGRLQLPTIAGTVISHRMPRVRPEDEPRNILPGQGSKRLAERLLRNNPNLPEEKGSSVGAVISQRMPRLRPDKTAVAPMSAADIAARLLRDFGLEKVG